MHNVRACMLTLKLRAFVLHACTPHAHMTSAYTYMRTCPLKPTASASAPHTSANLNAWTACITSHPPAAARRPCLRRNRRASPLGGRVQVPYVDDSGLQKKRNDIWTSNSEFLHLTGGDFEEHAHLLASYFLQLGQQVCVGGAGGRGGWGVGGRAVWAVQRASRTSCLVVRAVAGI